MDLRQQTRELWWRAEKLRGLGVPATVAEAPWGGPALGVDAPTGRRIVWEDRSTETQWVWWLHLLDPAGQDVDEPSGPHGAGDVVYLTHSEWIWQEHLDLQGRLRRIWGED